ncbi:serine/threonine-protein kinase [Actinomadura terrae]|uniref:serine/threonine-protein kinase n=1 Tax=Actinomadura terrae TaxID=604353 RepID=UPI001FA77029|nr:serine/threonine-protein kinase [Actinomadura terrae]
MRPLEHDDPRQVETAGRSYRLLARIGSGGMGVVYLGRSTAGRAVAVKMAHREFAADTEFRDRFEREVNVARSVGGGFTATVVDADPQAEIPWLVTEFLPSVSLRDAVRASGPLATETVWALAAGVAEALVSIHAAGVVHRDLKPSNVLLTADGPRVIDFGIARAVDAASVSRPGARTGSPGFMSPEQAAGATVGPAGDVFSFGATLAFACTGEEPFGPGPWHAQMLRIQSEAPRLDGIADPELRALIEECMRRDPAHRPTAVQLAERLAGRGVLSLTQPVADGIARSRAEAENPPSAKAAGRRGALWAGAVGATVLVSAAALFAVWHGTRDGTEAAPSATRSAAPAAPSASSTASSTASGRKGSPSPTGKRGDIRFSLAGEGRVIWLRYTINGKTTKLTNVKLPWRKTLPMLAYSPKISWRFDYKATDDGIRVAVTMNGQAISEGSGNGIVVSGFQ